MRESLQVQESSEMIGESFLLLACTFRRLLKDGDTKRNKMSDQDSIGKEDQKSRPGSFADIFSDATPIVGLKHCRTEIMWHAGR